MLRAVFFTPSNADIKKCDAFVKKMNGDVQQSASGGAMFHAGSRLRYHIGVITDEEELIATITLYVRQLPFGLSWLYCPRGPVWEKPQKETWNVLFSKIRNIARRERAIFLRIEPDEKEQLDISTTNYTSDPRHPWAGISDFKLKFGGSIFRYHPAVEYIFSPFWYFIFLTIKNIKNFFLLRTDFQKNTTKDISSFWKNRRFRRAHAHYQPEYTNMVDLSLSEAEILAQMKPKGRYNIHLAEKKGIKIMSCLKASDAADIFYNLFQETTHRDKFSGHDKTFYENVLKIGGESGIAKLYIAYLSTTPIVAIIVTSFGDRATYFYGASSNAHRNLMAPYLLQWTAMLDAKKEGKKWYDLFGIAPCA